MNPTPDQLNEPLFVWLTLEWCNERRAEKHLPPLDRMPLGVRSNPESCPCGKTAEMSVGTSKWNWIESYSKDGIRNFEVPLAVQHFIHAFDTGQLPQYDEQLARRSS